MKSISSINKIFFLIDDIDFKKMGKLGIIPHRLTFMAKHRLISSSLYEAMQEEMEALFLENAYLRLNDKQREIDALKLDLQNHRERQEMLMAQIEYLVGELSAGVCKCCPK